MTDFALFIDDECAALGDGEESFSEDRFLTEDSVCFADDSLWITDQGEW